nr:hypothetical protein [Tanacetum cinerariifolium]
EVGHWKWNFPVYLAELLKKKKQVGIASSLDNCHYTPSTTRCVVSIHHLVENGFIQHFMDFGILDSKSNVFCFNAIPSNDIYEIDMHDLVPNVNSIYNVSTKRSKHNLDSTCLLHCHLAHLNTCQDKVLATSLHSRMIIVVKDYALESAKRILNMVPTKKVDKTPYKLWYEKVPNLSYLKVLGCEALLKRDMPEKLQQRSVKCIFIEVSGRAIDLEEIQDEDTLPLEITSKISMEVEGFEPPQEKVISIRRSERTHRAPNRLCLNVEVEEHNNMVWVLVDLPPGCKTVGSKWIFKKKTNMDGIVHTYKARLVAKGYTQLYGVDYEGTFLPVADIRAIRILVSIAAYYDYEIWQIDVKTAFLDGYLDEDVYMVQPEGFVDPNHLRKVCKLQRSIYGLKQASRSWNKRFDEQIKKDMSKRLIRLGQNAYMEKILKRYKMDNSKCGHIPMQERLDLDKTQGASIPKKVKRMQNIPYASAVGSIMYDVRYTRLDVAFGQNITSRFQQNYDESHWTAVKNILKYLRNTKDLFLVYGRNPKAELRVDCYCNA